MDWTTITLIGLGAGSILKATMIVRTSYQGREITYTKVAGESVQKEVRESEPFLPAWLAVPVFSFLGVALFLAATPTWLGSMVRRPTVWALALKDRVESISAEVLVGWFVGPVMVVGLAIGIIVVLTDLPENVRDHEWHQVGFTLLATLLMSGMIAAVGGYWWSLTFA